MVLKKYRWCCSPVALDSIPLGGNAEIAAFLPWAVFGQCDTEKCGQALDKNAGAIW
jgi:hypothetical protein